MSPKFAKIKGLIRPIDYTLDGNSVKERYYPYVEGMSFANHLNNHNRNVPSNIIIDYIMSVEKTIRDCHEAGMVFPDLLSGENILYNPNSKEISLLDYDGIQIEKLPSFGMSDFIFKPHNTQLFHNSKYYKNGLYTKNIDLYSIYVTFVYYTTKLNMPKDHNLNYNLEGYLKSVNL